MNVWMFRHLQIKNYEMGLRFRNGEFVGLMLPGRHTIFDPLSKTRVDVVSLRNPWLVHDQLDMIVKSGVLEDRATVLDLKDFERALVWIDGRFSHILPPGLYAYWTALRDVKVEIVDARNVRFEHPQLQVISRAVNVERTLEVCAVDQGRAGVLFLDGQYTDTLGPGRYAFWKNIANVKLCTVDLRETMLDIAGQDVMTADKVTLRLNAVLAYRVLDARRALTVVDDLRQTLYRETQLALRVAVSGRDLDAFLTDKDAVASEMETAVRDHAQTMGLEIVSAGIRDVILPGDMKDLMNKVTEAKKAAEANLIVRREETAAMRSQANTAKVLEGNPTLMRLRELEVLEKIASAGKLNIVLGEKGLTEHVVNLL